MQSLLTSTTTVCILLHVLSPCSVTAQGTPGFNYSLVSCNFSSASCGWVNVGGEYNATWVLDGTNAHMYLRMNGDAKGRLASPWLDPLGDYQCYLKFDFVLERWPWVNCQLTLIRQTASGSEQNVKVMNYDTGLGTSSDTATEAINCSGERYRIVFEGWKSCDSIWVDDIVYTLRYTGTPPSTSLPSTAGATSTPASDDTGHSQTPSGPHVTSSTSAHVTSSTNEHVTSSISSHVTSSTRHQVTSSTSHYVTSSTSHRLTSSTRGPVASSASHQVTSSTGHHVASATTRDTTISRAVVTSSLETSTDPGQEWRWTSPEHGTEDHRASELDSGLLGGVIVAALLVLILVIVIVVLLWKIRRGKDKSNVYSSRRAVPLAVVNPACSTVNNEGNHGGHRRNHAASPAQEGLELTHLPSLTTTTPQASEHVHSNLRPNPHHHATSTVPALRPPLPSPASTPSPFHGSVSYENVAAAPRVSKTTKTSKGENRQNNLPSKPVAAPSVTTSSDRYDHRTRVELRPASNDNGDRTNGQPPPSVSENRLHYANDRQPPSAPSGRGDSYYSNVRLDSHPAADTPAYTNVPQRPHLGCGVFLPPHVKLDTKHHAENHSTTPPTTTITTSFSSSPSAMAAPAVTSNYAVVSSGRDLRMASYAEQDDARCLLGVPSQRRRERGVGGDSVYENTKESDYDTLQQKDNGDNAHLYRTLFR